MQKRGDEVLTTTLLFEFLAGILIAGILFYTLTTLNDRSAIAKDSLEKDHAAVINIIKSMPGDIEMTYDIRNFYWDKGQGKFIQKGERLALKIIKKDGAITEEPFQLKNEQKS